MNVPAGVVPPRRELARELAPLIAGTEGQGMVALVNLSTGRALTLGDSPKASGQALGIDASLLPMLARALLGRSIGAEVGRIAAECDANGGVTSASLLLPQHDLVLSRLPGSTEALCLVVRHAPASVAALDSIVHARGVHTRLQSVRKTRASTNPNRPQPAQHSMSLWSKLIAAWHGHSHAHEPAGGKVTQPQGAPEGSSSLLHASCDIDERILAADLFDLSAQSHAASYRRAGCGIAAPRSALLAGAISATFEGRLALAPIAEQYGLEPGAIGKARMQIGRREVYLLRVPYYPALRIPFDEREVLMVVKPPRGNPALDWTAMDRVALNLLRMRIGELLASGMATQMSPFPANQVEFQAILDRLADLPEEDLMGRLDIGGFAPRPVEMGGVEQRCAECIYYLPHRKWCDLPELPVPVEPQWWCRLWKL
ncbi:MAG TPA: hypothetical protein VM845_14980 [Burkholderiaceae bacterium]|nr:hypothetical protein [Burkholderiaceae bacterium]